MKKIVSAVLLLAPLLAGAQKSGTFMEESSFMLSDLGGKPVGLRSEYRVEGTPFLNANYCLASLQISKGKRYPNLPVKLNLGENAVYYKIGDENEMIAINEIEKVEFTDCGELGHVCMQSGFPPVDRQDNRTFYQVLTNGNVLLLKHYAVNYRDEKPYSSASISRIYETKVQYYAYSPQKGIVRLSKDNESVLAVLSTKQNDVRKFIEAEKIRVKKEEDLVKLFTFYNTL